ncbi:uncharacterized protein LOC117614834 [Prunus dulcis]|nr:uncharacterized protein LOC117614834 [Prunus dulcis]
MYQQLMGSTFVYEHCWHLLKDQPKWTTETSKKKSKTSPNACPASSSPCIPCAVNLGQDSQESRCIERPEGKKAAKRLASQRKGKNPMGGNAESAIDLQMEIQELRKQKLEHARIQDEQFQLMYVAKQEQLAIRREEVLIQRRSEDSRIMAMDTTDMLSMQAEYIIGLQKDILSKAARRNKPQKFAD